MRPGTRHAGVVVPMVSPFTPGGAIDESAAGRIVRHLLAARVAGIFVLGTTGEAASTHPEERRRLVRAVVETAGGRALVYAGISGNCQRESAESAADYHALGADVAVAHPPFYYPVPEADLARYFAQLADAIPLPLMLYNIPKITRLSVPPDVTDALSRHPNVVGIKDSAGHPQGLVELLARVGGRDGFSVLVGSAPLSALGLRHGADGLVPSTANLVPDLYQRMYEAAQRPDWDEVEHLQQQTDLISAGYQHGRLLGQSLAALKRLMSKQGLCGPTVLPPLVADDPSQEVSDDGEAARTAALPALALHASSMEEPA